MTIHMLTAALALLLHRGPIPEPVATAIESACHAESVAHPVDENACVSLVTFYASRESAYRAAAVGDGGRSCSILQQRCSRIRGLSLTEQVALWLRDLRASSLASVDSDAKRAAHRARLAASLLDTVTRERVAERQP
jgi:hypothetical protein